MFVNELVEIPIHLSHLPVGRIKYGTVCENLGLLHKTKEYLLFTVVNMIKIIFEELLS